jgi:hypothetical protein
MATNLVLGSINLPFFDIRILFLFWSMGAIYTRDQTATQCEQTPKLYRWILGTGRERGRGNGCGSRRYILSLIFTAPTIVGGIQQVCLTGLNQSIVPRIWLPVKNYMIIVLRSVLT